MAYLYIDENNPESSEYSSNYLYFNEKEPGMLGRMMRKCIELQRSKSSKSKSYKILNDDSYPFSFHYQKMVG